MSATVQFKAELNENQLFNLKEFSTRGERSEPVSFVGRTEILDQIKSRILFAKNAALLGPETHVIYGPPGSGKTSTLRKIAEMCAELKANPVYIEGEVLYEPVQVLEKIYRSVGDSVSLLSKSRTEVQSSEADVSLKILDFDGGVKYKQTTERPIDSMRQQVAAGSSIWSVLDENLDKADDHVLVMLIDEAQRIEAPVGREVNPLVTAMYSGETDSLKVIPIFAGLGDTVSRLHRAGLSRKANTHYILGSLDPDEPEQVTLDFLSDPIYGMAECYSVTDSRKIAKLFEAASERWPRHLHHYLQGLAREVTVNFEAISISNELSVINILVHGDNSRLDYYEEILDEASYDDFYLAIQEVLNLDPSTYSISIDSLVKQPVMAGYSRREVSALIDDGIHAGMLTRNRLSRGEYSIAIPSFATYMRNGRNRKKTLEIMLSQHYKTLRDLGW